MPGRASGRDHRLAIISVFYLLVRCLLDCLAALSRDRVSKEAELLLLCHENAVLRRQIGRFVTIQPTDCAYGAVAVGSAAVGGARCSR